MSASIIRLEKEFAAIDWSRIPYVIQWDSAIKLLHHLSSLVCSRADLVRLRATAIQCIEKGVVFDSIFNIWREILTTSSSARVIDDHGLINAFRLFSNALEEQLPDWGIQKNYIPVIMKSLIHNIGKGSYCSPNLSYILSSFSETNLGHFSEELVAYEDANTVAAIVAQATDPIFGLNIAKIILRHTAKVICNNGDNHHLSMCQSLAMHFITNAHLREVPTNEILDTIALSSRIRFIPAAYIPLVSRTLSQTLVAALPKEQLPHVLETVGGVWGDKTFVASADSWKQAYYTHILLEALLHGESSHLYTKGDSGVSADFLLSMGISNYLDVDNISIRKHGMRVAEAYATLLGEPLSFAELKAVSHDEEVALYEAQMARSSGSPDAQNTSSATYKITSSSSKTAKQEEKQQPNRLSSAPTSAAVIDTLIDSDNDSDDELQGFSLDEGVNNNKVFDYKDKLLRTNYLRDCLIMLRCPEEKPEARQQLEAALVRIPVIMASNPPDSADLCEPLMKELLTVSDAFNINEFDAKRSNAVQAVLQAHPHVAVPFLTTQLLGNDLPLGVKLLVLEWLMTSSKILSNIDMKDEKSSGATGTPPPISLPTASTSTTAITSTVAGAGAGAGGDPINGKTIIKRPGKLAQLSTRVTYFRNKFGPLSGLFIFPIIQLLGKIWNNTHNEVTPVLSADKFNLISELFENGGKKTGSTAGKVGFTPDLTLSHLDGSDVLLPSQCLVALGLFARCAVNTTNQREHALNVAKVASMFRLASAVALRRAALYALRLSFEAYLPTNSSGSGNNNNDRRLSAAGMPIPNGPMDELCNISSRSGSGMISAEEEEAFAGAGEDSAAAAIISQRALVEVVDWAATTWKDDADEVARALKREIVAIAVNGMKP